MIPASSDNGTLCDSNDGGMVDGAGDSMEAPDPSITKLFELYPSVLTFSDPLSSGYELGQFLTDLQKAIDAGNCLSSHHKVTPVLERVNSICVEKLRSCQNSGDFEDYIKVLVQCNLVLEKWTGSASLTAFTTASITSFPPASLSAPTPASLTASTFGSSLETLCSLITRSLVNIYRLCSDSRQLYREQFLSSVSSALARLFRSAVSVQSSLLSLLDQCLNNATFLSDHGNAPATTLCQCVYDLACNIADLDMRQMADTWKLFAKLADVILSNHHDDDDGIIPPALVAGVIFCCQRVARSLTELVDLGRRSTEVATNAGRGRCIKLCVFFLKLVVGLVEKWGEHLHECGDDLLNSVLLLLRYSVPDDSMTDVSDAIQQQLSNQVTVAAEPLLSAILATEWFPQCFVRVMWRGNDNCSASEPQQHLSLCRLRLCVILLRMCCQLKQQSRQTLTMMTSPSVIDVTLWYFAKCSKVVTAKVELPCTGLIEPPSSLYQVCLISICSYLAVLDSEEFAVGENAIWLGLSCRGHRPVIGRYHCQMICSDALCFIVRYGPASLCYHYCELLFARLAATTSPTARESVCAPHVCAADESGDNCGALWRLLARLCSRLSHSDRRLLLDQQSTHQQSARLPLTLLLLLTADSAEFSADLSSVCQQLVSLLRLILTSDQHECRNALACDSLWILNLAGISLIPPGSDTSVWTTLCTVLSQLLDKNSSSHQLLCAVISAVATTSRFFSDRHLFRVFEAAVHAVKTSTSDVLHTCAVDLVFSVASRKFADTSGFSAIANLVAALFNCNTLPKHMCLEAMYRLAKRSPHSTLITLSCATAPELKSALSHFIRCSQLPSVLRQLPGGGDFGRQTFSKRSAVSTSRAGQATPPFDGVSSISGKAPPISTDAPPTTTNAPPTSIDATPISTSTAYCKPSLSTDGVSLSSEVLPRPKSISYNMNRSVGVITSIRECLDRISCDDNLLQEDRCYKDLQSVLEVLRGLTR